MFTFDSDNFDIPETPSKSFGPLPDANYNVKCVDANLEDNDKGQFISLKWEVTDGEYAGQWVWDRLFMEGGYFDGHAEKGQQNLARILKYSGINAIKKDVFELVDAEVGIKTKQRENPMNPDKPRVNVAFYNPKKKGGSETVALPKAEAPSTPAPAPASLEDEPPF